MKRILSLIALTLLMVVLVGCGSKKDDEVMSKLSNALVERWEYSDKLEVEKTKDELLKAVDIELDLIGDYGADDFKDTLLYGRWTAYKSELELVKIKLDRLEITDNRFTEEWNEHREKRAMHLYNINKTKKINIPNEYSDTFKKVLADADRLIEINELTDVLSEIKHLDNLNVDIEGDAIAIEFSTNSILTVNKFVSDKTGFPDDVIDILNKLKEHEYKNIVISTTNNDILAISIFFEEDDLNNIDLESWKKIDSADAHKIYKSATAYHIRSGIWEELDSDIKKSIGDMNKRSENDFWLYHGFQN